MSDYVCVNCIESCPKCKNKIRMERLDMGARYEWDMYVLDCKYIKNIILNPRTGCCGMFEPKVKNE